MMKNLENNPNLPKLREILLNCDGIIFDMDGLMIDSEPYHCLAFDKVFQRFGKRLSEEDNTKYYVGISDKDAAMDMCKRYELPISPEELVKQKQDEYLKLLTQVSSQPGLFEVLQALATKGYKMAIASSSMISEIEAVVGALEIRGYFESICSAQEVKHGKPAPDIFLLAAKKLNVAPNRCLVLEDATSGIIAANHAGMRSIAIPSRETLGRDFTLASGTLGSLLELVHLLANK